MQEAVKAEYKKDQSQQITCDHGSDLHAVGFPFKTKIDSQRGHIEVSIRTWFSANISRLEEASTRSDEGLRQTAADPRAAAVIRMVLPVMSIVSPLSYTPTRVITLVRDS